MADFISTTGGKIVNVEAIAFLTSRTPSSQEGEDRPTQLIVGFSAATSVGSGGMMPLSLVLESAEAVEFLEQLSSRGVVIDHLRSKLG